MRSSKILVSMRVPSMMRCPISLRSSAEIAASSINRICEKPLIAFNGVRISCVILLIKAVLAKDAASARSRSNASCLF